MAANDAKGRSGKSVDAGDTAGGGAAGELHQQAADGHPELTTNQGVPVADNQNSLKAGLRGPTLLEDFILREKITHFDHERIPERVVHARGSAAHGVFTLTKSLKKYTTARVLTAVGEVTETFVRFSTVNGSRGSADTVRDARGFATKTSLMLGLGETNDEVLDVLFDLREVGVNVLTLGQYLQPGEGQLPVESYVKPEVFDMWKRDALAMGFDHVESGPMVCRRERPLREPHGRRERERRLLEQVEARLNHRHAERARPGQPGLGPTQPCDQRRAAGAAPGAPAVPRACGHREA